MVVYVKIEFISDAFARFGLLFSILCAEVDFSCSQMMHIMCTDTGPQKLMSGEIGLNTLTVSMNSVVHYVTTRVISFCSISKQYVGQFTGKQLLGEAHPDVV